MAGSGPLRPLDPALDESGAKLDKGSNGAQLAADGRQAAQPVALG